MGLGHPILPVPSWLALCTSLLVRSVDFVVRGAKIQITFFVLMNTGVGRVVWCVHEHRPTGEVGLPDRPTEQPGYAQIAQARPTTTQHWARAVRGSLIII